jgi:hypothetical protein
MAMIAMTTSNSIKVKPADAAALKGHSESDGARITKLTLLDLGGIMFLNDRTNSSFFI